MMKLRIVFVVVLLSSVTCVTYGQKKINVSSPFEKISPSYNARGEVSISIRLREAATGDVSGALSKFNVSKMIIKSDNVTGTVLPNPRADDNSLDYSFTVPVDTSNPTAANDANNVFRLGRDWKSFDYTIDYQFTVDAIDPQSNPQQQNRRYATLQVQKSLVDPTRTKEITSKIKNPVWSGGRELYVPLEITGDEVYVEVTLASANGTVATGGAIFGRERTSQNVRLKVNEDSQLTPTTQYGVKITAPSRSDIKFSQAELPIVTLQNSSGYAIDTKTILDLAKVKISYNTENTTFSVRTNVPGKLTLTLAANGRTISGTKSDNTQTFTLRPTDFVDMPDGPVLFSFRGESDGLVPLSDSDKFYSIIKDTSVQLVGLSKLTLDSNNFLHFTYSLSRQIDNEVEISQDIRAGGKPAATASEPNRYEAIFNLNLATNKDGILKLISTSGDNKKAPITLSIYVTGDGLKSRLLVGGIQVDAVNLSGTSLPPTVVQAITNAAQQVKDKKEDQARQVLSSALKEISPTQNPDEQTIEALVTLLKQKTENGRTGKDKVISILSFAGRIVANYFGVPIPAK